MKSNSRTKRINDEIMREVAHIIRVDVKDPRISTVASVSRVETSMDLSVCKIYISVYGSESVRSETMAGLNSARGLIRRLLAERINLRHTPELNLILDESLDYALRMEKLIDEVNRPNDSE